MLGVVACHVSLVCVWPLVTMVRRGTVFCHAAFRYVVLGAGVAVLGKCQPGDLLRWEPADEPQLDGSLQHEAPLR
ncbi:MAG: DUF2975 domain-containing protein [Thermocrispum sp.]